MEVISNQPTKGTKDWLPEEVKIRQYIFKIWRQVCLRYGFQEYLTPLMENANIYRAKSGEDVGGKELFIFQDAGGRELTIRPEMTPSVTRLVSRVYKDNQKPIKYFSIANFVRNEKPQRGRNREFWQLNLDIFGSESLKADLEIIQISLDLMLAFQAPKNSFVLYINNRKLLDEFFDFLEITEAETKKNVFRVLDKWEKLSEEDFIKKLQELELEEKKIEDIKTFLTIKDLNEFKTKFPDLEDSSGLKEVEEIMTKLEALDYQEYIAFKPSIIRGFDYYDGLVFEVFDNNPENIRALFGGGRYNGLASIFGQDTFPAVGVAPGDEPIKLFLESWDLLKDVEDKQETYYFPLLNKTLELEVLKLAKKLREEDFIIETGFREQRINKALDYANKKGFSKMIILGQEEKEKGVYKIKDMKTSQEEERELV